VNLLDAQSGEEVESFIGHEGAVTSLAFSRDGAFILSGGDDGAARLWEIGAGRARFHWAAVKDGEGKSQGYSSARFSPDGELLAAICSDRSARVWDLRAGVQRSGLRGHTATINAIAFSPDGASLASCAGERPPAHARFQAHDPKDTTTRVWDVETGAQTAVLAGHVGAVLDVAVSPDG
jgi:WD40 repeat protein